ncbi:MAG: hypothetical protein ACKVT1_12385 [Dehalococcoidia bacterium]
MKLSSGAAAFIAEFLRLQDEPVWRRMISDGLHALPDQVQRELRDLLASELQRTGFDSTWTPTAHGRAIEEIVAWLSPE